MYAQQNKKTKITINTIKHMYAQALSEGLESMANLEELDIKSESVGARGCRALASSFKGVLQ
jgi:Ran GTPase-activating protein (RanGAP) involved in mRNA processing and transport